MAIWMAVFFALVSALAGLLLFPGLRDALAAGSGRLQSRLLAVTERWHGRLSGHAADGSRSMRDAGGRSIRTLSRHRFVLLAAALVLCVPPLLVLQLRQRPLLDGFASGELEPATDSQILELLRGERLTPPMAPPPEVFITADAEASALAAQTGLVAISVPQHIVSADRRWQRVDPDFQQRVLAVYRLMREQYGYEMVLVEGYRSPERQRELARKGRGTTLAGAGQSCHQYGLAVDSAPIRDGKLQWDMRDPWTRRGYALYGQLAQQAGLEWGGAWRSIKDYVHLEHRSECRAARRAAGK